MAHDPSHVMYYDHHAVDFDGSIDPPGYANAGYGHAVYSGGEEAQQQWSPEQMQALHQQQEHYRQHYGLAPATDMYGDGVGFIHPQYGYIIPPEMLSHPSYARYTGYPPTGYPVAPMPEEMLAQRAKSKKPVDKPSQLKPKEKPVRLPPIKPHTQLKKLQREADRIQHENLLIFERLQRVRSSGYPGGTSSKPLQRKSQPHRSASQSRSHTDGLRSQGPRQEWQA
uniref:Uncharacterized protein n=1 Tax=Eutreptiella gymnastica TaxID=73025 RepID=A0A7S1IB48_9EUGL